MPLIVCISDPLSPRARAFRAKTASRHDILFLAPTASPTTLAEALRNAACLVIDHSPLPARLLEAAPDLKLLQLLTCSNVRLDIPAWQKRGVAVASVSAAVAAHVAEFTVALMLAAIRLPEGAGGRSREELVRRVAAPGATDPLRGKTIGIVGLGRAGESVARRLKPAGAHLVYADIRTAPRGLASELGLRRVTLDRLLTLSDILSIHVPWGPTANPLIQERELRVINPAAALVSASDPGVIDAGALSAALQEGRLAGAALDHPLEIPSPSKTEGQPGHISSPSKGEGQGTALSLSKGVGRSPARSLPRDTPAPGAIPNLITTSGVASDTPEADAAAANFALSNITRALSGQQPEGLVEILDYPRAGDPAFWSSAMYPRKR